MKKLLILATLVVVFVITYTIPNIGKTVQNDNVKCEYFTDGNVTGRGVYMYGNVYMVETNSYNADTVNGLGKVIGITAKFEGDYDKFLEILKICGIAEVSSEIIDNVHIVYGISEMSGKCVSVAGKAVNIQVALNNNKIIVGTPLIMGSY